MKNINAKIKVRLAPYCVLAICLLTMICTGCGGGGDGGNPPPPPQPPPSFEIEYAHLMYRNYEDADNRYQRVIGITDNGGPIQETDIIDVRITDSSGSAVISDTEGFYHDTYMLFDCMSENCTDLGTIEDTGIWGRYSMLALDTYHIEIDMENGQMLSTDEYYPGEFVLPYVSGTDMLASWSDGDLVLEWANPDTDLARREVDQLRIVVFDDNGNIVLKIKTKPTVVAIRIPAAIVSQAATLLGGDSLAQWEVRTRAHDANNMNFARGYSSRMEIPQPILAITPGQWSGDAGFGKVEFEVTSDSAGIKSFTVIFLDYTCGAITHGGSRTSTWTPALTIVNRQIDIDISLSLPAPDYLAIEGTFEASGDFISGDFELDNGIAVCSGTWSAQPVTTN